MPDYKKKKHSRIFNTPAKASRSRMQKKGQEEKIVMAPKKKVGAEKPNTENMRVVRGKKYTQKQNTRTGLYIVAVILVIAVVVQLILPVGIFDTVSNGVALLGSGSYPIELSSTSTQDAVSKGSYYYLLSSENVAAYSNSGEELFIYAHGFEYPAMKTSDSRAIVFNQGGNEALVFDLRGLKEKLETENSVITAAVSDSGRFAIATRSEKYTAQVTVYDKRGGFVYEWFSAEDTINNVALSPNGKKIAVSTFNSANGIFKSTLNILNFKSATPEFKLEFSDSPIYSLDTTHPSYIAAVTSSSVQFVKWSNHKVKEYKNEYSTSFFRGGKGGFVAVFNRESDNTDNRIAVFSKSGKLKSEVEFKGIISDIQVYSGHIYCISDTSVYLISKDGEILRTASCGYGSQNLSVTGTNTVAVISDSKIEKIKLERKNEE